MKQITQTRYFQILTLFEQQPNKKFTYRGLSQAMALKPRIIEHVLAYLIADRVVNKFPNLFNMRECYFLLNLNSKGRSTLNNDILIQTRKARSLEYAN